MGLLIDVVAFNVVFKLPFNLLFDFLILHSYVVLLALCVACMAHNSIFQTFLKLLMNSFFSLDLLYPKFAILPLFLVLSLVPDSTFYI